jgi:ribosome biogenesis protein UTP30
MAEGMDESLVEKAITALQKHEAIKRKNSGKKRLEGLGDTSMEYVYLRVTLFRVPSKARACPIRMKIPHSFFDKEDVSSCLIVKDPAEDWKSKVEGVTKIMGLSKLKRKFKSYEARRQLLDYYDLFLVDRRVMPAAGRALGKKFFVKKKHPSPVDLTNGKASEDVADALRSAYYFESSGAISSVKIGLIEFKAKEIVENVVAAANALGGTVPGGWKNVQALHLKTKKSVSIPIYETLPEEDVVIEEKEAPTNIKDLVKEYLEDI